ncbi:MAG: uracil-DNA glycosylase [Pseudomonadota bacterium]
MSVKKDVIHYLSYLDSRGVRTVSNTPAAGGAGTSAETLLGEIRNDKPLYGDIFNTSNKFTTLDEVKAHVGVCKKCRLNECRKTIVFGEGAPQAKLMFIGEGPGQDEDETGRPFVGRAGQLLTKIIEAMGLKREDVYIANIVKCRPPANRTPADDEIIACAPYLAEQISVIKPKVIVALGAPATCTLFNRKIKISEMRGKFYDWMNGVKLMPTFHPAYLLRNPVDKKLVWDDMKKVMELMRD